jgi:outer membrane protein TolC
MAQVDARMGRLGLAVRAAGLVADWYDFQARDALLAAGIQTLGQLESSTRERYARGLGSLADQRMAAEELSMLRADRAMLAGDLDATRIALNGLRGLPFDAPLDAPTAPPGTGLPATLDAVEVAEARARVDEAAAGVDMARAARLPALGWMASYELVEGDPWHGLMVGGMVEVPVDLRAGRAAVDAAEAERRRAEAHADAAAREADIALAQARAMVSAQEAVVARLETEVLPAAAASVAAARTAYEAGHDDAQMLLMALHRQHDALGEAATARAELYKRQAMAWMAAGQLPPAWEGAP